MPCGWPIAATSMVNGPGSPSQRNGRRNCLRRRPENPWPAYLEGRRKTGGKTNAFVTNSKPVSQWASRGDEWWRAMRQGAANRAVNLPEIADDFAAKSADNGHGLEPRQHLPEDFPMATKPRGDPS